MAQAEQVYLGLGSNVDAHNKLAAGVSALRERFGHVECSPVYQSESVGFEGEDFLNACCRISSRVPLSRRRNAPMEIDRLRIPLASCCSFEQVPVARR